MIGLTSLEVYNSVFNTNTKNIKFELYTDAFDKFSFEELKGELEEILTISDITPYHLQREKIGPRIIEAYKKLRSEKSSTDGYFILSMGYARSPFRHIESFLRIVVGLDEDDCQLILIQYYSIFVTYKIAPRIYTIKDISEAVYTMGDHEGTLQFEYDDFSMKTNFILTRFSGNFGRLGSDDKSFFKFFFKFYTIKGLYTY